MSEGMEDLARRAVACPAFRPMRGMVGVDGEVITYDRRYGDSWHVTTSEMVQEYHCGVRYDEPWQGSFDDLLRKGGWLPNFDQPATRGCLLALVREALGHDVWIEPVARQGEPVRWCVYGLAVVWDSGDYDTQAAALVAALESASP